MIFTERSAFFSFLLLCVERRFFFFSAAFPYFFGLTHCSILILQKGNKLFPYRERQTFLFCTMHGFNALADFRAVSAMALFIVDLIMTFTIITQDKVHEELELKIKKGAFELETVVTCANLLGYTLQYESFGLSDVESFLPLRPRIAMSSPMSG